MQDIRRHHAEGTQDRGGMRNDNAPNRQVLRIGAGEQATAAAEGLQREFPRIEAAFDGDVADEIRDARYCDLIDPQRRGVDIHAERASDHVGEDLAGRFDVEPQRAAQERPRIHIAQNGGDVGQGRLVASEPVADRTRPGTGAGWADCRASGPVINPDNAAAAGADRHQIDLGRNVVIAVDQRFPRIF